MTVLYGSRKYGLRWEFRLDENVIVFWQGDKPDWLVADSEAVAFLTARYSRATATEFLAGLLDSEATCEVKSVARVLNFSDI